MSFLRLSMFPSSAGLLALWGCTAAGNGDFGVTDLEPDISADPQVLEFGWVEEGDENIQSLLVTNAGQGSLLLNSLILSDGAEVAYTISNIAEGDLPLVVDPETGTTEIAVAFSPPRGEFGPQTLTIESDDPDTSTLNITLKGNSGIPYRNVVAQSNGTVGHNWYIAGATGRTGMDLDLEDARDLDWDGGAVALFNQDNNLDIALSFPGSPRSYTLYTRTNAGLYLSQEWDPGTDLALRFAADVDLDGVMDLIGSDPDPAYEGGSNPGTMVYVARGTSSPEDAQASFAPADPLLDLGDLVGPGDRLVWPTSARDLDASSDPNAPRQPDLLFGVIPQGVAETDLYWFASQGDGTFAPAVLVGTLPEPASFLEGLDWLPGYTVDLLWGSAADPGQIRSASGVGDGTFALDAAVDILDFDEGVESDNAAWPDRLWSGSTRFGDDAVLESVAVAIPGEGGWDLQLLITDEAGGGEGWLVTDTLPRGEILVSDDHTRP